MLLVLVFYFLYISRWMQIYDRTLKYGGPPPCPVCRIWLQTPWLVLLCIEFYSDLNKAKKEREMLWQCCCWTVCGVSIQHSRGVAPLSPCQLLRAAHSLWMATECSEWEVTNQHCQEQVLCIKYSSGTKLTSWQYAKHSSTEQKLEKWTTEWKNRNTQICCETVFLKVIKCIFLF